MLPSKPFGEKHASIFSGGDRPEGERTFASIFDKWETGSGGASALEALTGGISGDLNVALGKGDQWQEGEGNAGAQSAQTQTTHHGADKRHKSQHKPHATSGKKMETADAGAANSTGISVNDAEASKLTASIE